MRMVRPRGVKCARLSSWLVTESGLEPWASNLALYFKSIKNSEEEKYGIFYVFQVSNFLEYRIATISSKAKKIKVESVS